MVRRGLFVLVILLIVVLSGIGATAFADAREGGHAESGDIAAQENPYSGLGMLMPDQASPTEITGNAHSVDLFWGSALLAVAMFSMFALGAVSFARRSPQPIEDLWGGNYPKVHTKFWSYHRQTKLG